MYKIQSLTNYSYHNPTIDLTCDILVGHDERSNQIFDEFETMFDHVKLINDKNFYKIKTFVEYVLHFIDRLECNTIKNQSYNDFIKALTNKSGHCWVETSNDQRLWHCIVF